MDCNKYSTMTVAQLKEILRKRNLKLSGKKKALVDRLVFNDASGPQPEPEPEFHMDLPVIGEYKDVHADMKTTLTPICQGRVADFYSCCNKEWEKKFEALYKESYIRYIRVTGTTPSTPNTFVKANVWAEMRKVTCYEVDIKMGISGVIEETQCECAVGQGPTAHCKHVAAVLFGLASFKRTGELTTEKTCTQVLQTFHTAKPHRGSPVKAKGFASLRKQNSMAYDPRPAHCRNRPGAIYDLRNRLINLQEPVRRPFMDQFPPANIEAFAHDHDYLPLTLEDTFLQKQGISTITAEKVAEIESLTRGQGSSTLWKEERRQRITASRFGEITKATDRKDKVALARSIIRPVPIRTAAVMHGSKYERVAIEQLEADFGITVLSSGLCICESHPMFAASPDGIIDASTLVEVKCPLSAFQKAINADTIPYLKQDASGSLTLEKKHAYYH